MWLDKETESLFLKYLDPQAVCTPAEIHRLAQGLLEGFRKACYEYGRDESLFEAFGKLVPLYRQIALKDDERIEVKEAKDIFEWWKESIGIPAIQGLILGISAFGQWAPAAFKLFLVVLYQTKQAWTRRQARKLVVALEGVLRETKDLEVFTANLGMYEKQAREERIWFSSPEVDYLADLLLNARAKVYA